MNYSGLSTCFRNYLSALQVSSTTCWQQSLPSFKYSKGVEVTSESQLIGHETVCATGPFTEAAPAGTVLVVGSEPSTTAAVESGATNFLWPLTSCPVDEEASDGRSRIPTSTSASLFPSSNQTESGLSMMDKLLAVRSPDDDQGVDLPTQDHDHLCDMGHTTIKYGSVVYSNENNIVSTVPPSFIPPSFTLLSAGRGDTRIQLSTLLPQQPQHHHQTVIELGHSIADGGSQYRLTPFRSVVAGDLPHQLQVSSNSCASVSAFVLFS